MTTPLPEPWGDAQIREAFIYDGGESEYRDPINGASEQRRTAGKIFDSWLTEHDAKVRAEIADEIEAERLDTGDGIGFEAYVNGLRRAEEIAREGRT